MYNVVFGAGSRQVEGHRLKWTGRRRVPGERSRDDKPDRAGEVCLLPSSLGHSSGRREEC